MGSEYLRLISRPRSERLMFGQPVREAYRSEVEVRGTLLRESKARLAESLGWEDYIPTEKVTDSAIVRLIKARNKAQRLNKEPALSWEAERALDSFLRVRYDLRKAQKSEKRIERTELKKAEVLKEPHPLRECLKRKLPFVGKVLTSAAALVVCSWGVGSLLGLFDGVEAKVEPLATPVRGAANLTVEVRPIITEVIPTLTPTRTAATPPALPTVSATPTVTAVITPLVADSAVHPSSRGEEGVRKAPPPLTPSTGQEMPFLVDSPKGPRCEKYRAIVERYFPRRWVNVFLRIPIKEAPVCNPNARGKLGEVGLTQIHPVHINLVRGRDLNRLKDPEENYRVAALIFEDELRKDKKGTDPWSVCTQGVIDCSPDE